MNSSVMPQHQRTRTQVLRFLLVGGSNTVFTYGIFVALGLVIAPWIAYTVAFGIGLVWTTLGSSRFVFGAAFSARKLLLFLASYLAVYGVGQLVIRLIDPHGVAQLLLSSLIVLICTTPLIFLIGRRIFGRRASKSSEKETAP